MNHLISQEWIDAQISKTGFKIYEGKLVMVKPKENPCVIIFGKGFDGVTCKQCAHLYRKHLSKTYIKCDLRPHTNGPGTDHKAGWQSCSKYQPIGEV